MLASDADRDTAVARLSDAYAAGRLPATELEDRTSRALAARTHGDLDQVLTGLGGFRLPSHHPVRKAMFVLLVIFAMPILLFGTLAVFGGQDLGDRAFGIVLLALVLPGLNAVRRWAWRRG